MSTAQLLDFGSFPKFGKLKFPDLEIQINKNLEKVSNTKDLEKLIKALNPLLKADKFNDLEQQTLRRLRQKAYDKKRNSKIFQKIKSPDLEYEPPKLLKRSLQSKNKVIENKDQNEKNYMENNFVSFKPSHPKKYCSFLEGASNALGKINGEAVLQKTPSFLFWFGLSALAAYFVWQQSLGLYSSAGFSSAVMAASGGLLMVLGFTAYYAVSRSFLAFLLCIYACCYEGYLMISGTVNDEISTQAAKIENNPELIFLDVAAKRDMEKYESLKQRYNNPESKVFQNEWFLKTHLNPAWEQSAKSHQEFIAKQASLMPSENLNQLTFLKIFYRLGLVLLCMIFVHRLFGRWVSKNN